MRASIAPPSTAAPRNAVLQVASVTQNPGHLLRGDGTYADEFRVQVAHAIVVVCRHVRRQRTISLCASNPTWRWHYQGLHASLLLPSLSTRAPDLDLSSGKHTTLSVLSCPCVPSLQTRSGCLPRAASRASSSASYPMFSGWQRSARVSTNSATASGGSSGCLPMPHHIGLLPDVRTRSPGFAVYAGIT